MSEQGLMTPSEVAQALHVSRSTVVRRIADGSLPAVKLGRARNSPLRVNPRDVQTLVEPVRLDSRQGLLSLETVAARCGRPVEWVLARARSLPIVEHHHTLFVAEQDLRAWLRAAEPERETR